MIYFIFLLQKVFDKKMVMRVHRIDYAEEDSIKTELAWILNLLETTDLKVVVPIKSVNSNLVETIFTKEMDEYRNVVYNNNYCTLIVVSLQQKKKKKKHE